MTNESTFRCLECGERMTYENNAYEKRIYTCAQCGTRHEVRCYKNGKVTVYNMFQKQAEESIVDICEGVPRQKFYTCLMLKENVPNPKADCETDLCPICGREIWVRKIDKEILKNPDAIKSCTMCALHYGSQSNQ